MTPLQGIAAVAPDVQVIFEDGSDLEAAKKAAAEADAVVIVAGYNFDDEGEYISGDDFGSMSGAAESVGGDRKPGLGLHKDEVELIQTAGPENPQFCGSSDWRQYHYLERVAGQRGCSADGLLSWPGRRHSSGRNSLWGCESKRKTSLCHSGR